MKIAGFVIYITLLKAFNGCSRRYGINRNCGPECRTDYDCETKEYRCVCDFECGYTCVRTETPHLCQPINAPLNGFVNYTDFGRFSSVAKFYCHVGYILYGPTSKTCQGDGWWSPLDVPVCIKDVLCSDPPQFAEAHYDPLPYYRAGTVIKYTCKPGYYSRDSNFEATCSDEGKWIIESELCKRKGCEFSKSFPYGGIKGYLIDSVNENWFAFGARIEFECEYGYRLEGPEYAVCTEEGWSHSFPVCKQIKCKIPREFMHGSIEELKYIYDRSSVNMDASLTFVCERGYKLQGSSRLTCTDKGWSDSIPQCIQIHCETPLEFRNGIIDELKYTPDWSKVVFNLESTLTFECNRGYILVGAEALICTEQGWSDAIPQCIPSKCKRPGRLENGKIKVGDYDADDYDIYEVGTVLTFECDRGYKTDGRNYSICTHDGWTDPPPICIRSVCESLGEIENGIVLFEDEAASAYDNFGIGSIVTFRCNYGYLLVGNNHSVCMHDGWNKAWPICTKVLCEVPKEFPHGTFEQAELDGMESYFSFGLDSVLLFKCDEGFALKGSEVLICTQDGWNDSIPICERRKKCTLPSLPEGVSYETHTPGDRIDDGTHVPVRCAHGYAMDVADKDKIFIISCTDGTINHNISGCFRACYVYDENSLSHGEFIAPNEQFRPTCIDGYVPSQEYFECVNGSFTLEKLCIPETVGEPQVCYIHDENSLHNGEVIAPNQQIRIQCADGYVASQEYYTCSNGSFSTEKFCHQGCYVRDVNSLNYGQLIASNEHFRPECVEGYVPAKESFTCLNGSFSTEEFCIQGCYVYDENSLSHGQFVLPNEQFRPKCMDGYIQSQEYFTCVNGSFSVEKFCIPEAVGQTPVCYIQDENSLVYGEVIASNQQIRVQCVDGYVPSQEYYTCVNGTFSIEKFCYQGCYVRDEHSINYGELIAPNKTLRTKCVDGYAPSQNYIGCVDGSFAVEKFCFPVGRECKVPELENVQYKSHQINEILEESDVVVYTCNVSSTMEVDRREYRSKCRNGQFVPSINCQTKCKQRPPLVQKSWMIFTSLSHLSIAYYKCFPGYKLLNESINFTRCHHGIWERPFPDCVRITCSKPSVPDNGYSSLILSDGSYKVTDYMTTFNHGDTVKLFCREGYTITGVEFSTCINGKWSPPPIAYCPGGALRNMNYRTHLDN